VVALANGIVMLFDFLGNLIVEMQAHSRSCTAIACHPTRAVFVTSGDDTFTHIFEVDGQTLDRIDVKLLLSSRVNDLMIVGC